MTALEKLQKSSLERHMDIEAARNEKLVLIEREKRNERNRKRYAEKKNTQPVIKRETLADAFKEVMEVEGMLSFVYLKRYKPAKVKIPKAKLFIEEIPEPELMPEGHHKIEKKPFVRAPAKYSNRSAINDYI